MRLIYWAWDNATRVLFPRWWLRRNSVAATNWFEAYAEVSNWPRSVRQMGGPQ